MSEYPDAPGHRGIDTSIEAAEHIASHSGRLQKLALATIREAGAAGLTALELAARLQVDRFSIQPRTTELKRLGLIRDSGQRRQNPSGVNAIVWVATGSAEVHGTAEAA
jgi:hypothetical protein